MPPENSGAAEVDRAAGELGAAEVAAVKDNAREVEVQALPGHRSVFSEVRGDDPDDSVADFAVGLEGKSLRLGSVLARIGLVGHAQIGAQHIDAGLPVLLPVISQARHGVHPGQPDSWLVTAQLLSRRGEPFVQGPGALLRERSVQLLALRLQRLVQLLALFSERLVQLLALLFECVSSVLVGRLNLPLSVRLR